MKSKVCVCLFKMILLNMAQKLPKPLRSCSFLVDFAHSFLAAITTSPIGNVRLQVGHNLMVLMTALDTRSAHPVDAAVLAREVIHWFLSWLLSNIFFSGGKQSTFLSLLYVKTKHMRGWSDLSLTSPLLFFWFSCGNLS